MNAVMALSSSNPSISVVIPAYKREKLILPTLRSLLQQTRQPSEVIVVDDASPDGTVEAVKAFAREHPALNLRCVVQERNQGVSAARNRGIREATGEWVAFLDSDDLWDPSHLEKLIEASTTSDAEVVFSKAKGFSDDDLKAAGKTWTARFKDAEEVQQAMIQACHILPSASMVRRRTLLAAGSFDECRQIQHAEDWDLWLRLIEANTKFCLVDAFTCLYRQHSDSACSQKVKLYPAGLFCLLKHRHHPRYSQADWAASYGYYQAKLARALYESETSGWGKQMFSAWCMDPLAISRAGALLACQAGRFSIGLRSFANRYLKRFI